MKRQKFSMVLNPEDYKNLRRLANKYDISMAALIRVALAQPSFKNQFIGGLDDA
jgi:hypothetical protein